MKKKTKKSKTKKINIKNWPIYLIILLILLGFIYFKNHRSLYTKNIQVVRLAQKTYKNGAYKKVVFFQNKKIIASQGFNNEGKVIWTNNIIPDGVVYEFYPDGALASKANFVNNQFNGWEKNYYPNGQLSGAFLYKNNQVIQGATYFDDGVLASNWELPAGKKEGLVTLYFHDGRPGIQALCSSGFDYLNLIHSVSLQ